ncbi:tyrosyl-dna phosphodiesterase domain-containing protein [Colletotrichum truncatum]|uniref:Tyrosyl-dna phosphodiesterase domain-containing protein n=1 Tax=Colletotrichum truncatum TaxID=5467 RepID=A0ACC3YI76_COLTU
MASSNDRLRSVSSGAEDDPDLALAIALSLQTDTNPANGELEAASTSTRPLSQTSKPTPGASFGALILDRQKMEEERLARAKKRSASQAGLYEQTEKSKTQRVRALDGHESNTTESMQPNISEEAASTPVLPFPKGVFKRTWALGYPRTGDDIKVEEVLQKEKLQLAVLSSFQWDEEWLLSKIDCTRTKMILVAYAANDAEKQAIRSNVPTGRIRFCFPPMHGGYMHSKLQILKYEGYLRIVIPSGNLVPYDWGETGVLENMVFIIDLPRLEKMKQTTLPTGTLFGNELRRFLRALGLEEKLVQSLDNYDFSETFRYGFVHSISGSHTNESWRHTGQSTLGYCGLGSTVRSLGLATESAVEVDYVASSLGSLNHGYLIAIYNACQGDSGMKEYESRQHKPTKSNARQASLVSFKTANIEPVDLQRYFRIYFPTEKTVLRSRGGKSAAGTICIQEKWWKSSTFPRELLRDCESARTGLLLHSKAIFVRERAHDGAVWAYVGSANLSESAWGRLVKDRDTGTAKLNCRNWECGVLVAVGKDAGIAATSTRGPAEQAAQARARAQKQMQKGCDVEESKEKQQQQQDDEDESASLAGAFGATMPIPMKVPAGSYTSGESAASRPWFFMKAD